MICNPFPINSKAMWCQLSPSGTSLQTIPLFYSFFVRGRDIEVEDWASRTDHHARLVAWASRPLGRGHPARAHLAGAGRFRDRRCEEIVEHRFTTEALRRRGWKRKGIFLCVSVPQWWKWQFFTPSERDLAFSSNFDLRRIPLVISA
jgi:hypothetical protein